MAELPSLPPAERAVDVAEYQPLSGVAVAAVAVSGLFAIILLVTVVTGFYTRKPALNSNLLLLAVAGFILAIVARMQIRRSEGTRTGLKLASVAWWISVIFGIAYGTYIFSSGLALRTQCKDFAKVWFDNLQRNDIETAFVLSVEPVRWPRNRPVVREEVEAEFPAQLQGFQQHELVRLFLRNGKDVNIAFVGVRDWTYQPAGYHVISTWRLTCPEGEADLLLALVASEGKELVGRQWHVSVGGESGMGEIRRTRYGRLINEMMGSAYGYTMPWLSVLGASPTSSYSYTLPMGEKRKALENKTVASALIAGGPVFSVAPKDLPEPVDFSPGFFRFVGKDVERDTAPGKFQRAWRSGGIVPSSMM